LNDRAVALLEQYDIEVLRTRKGRGAILCDTGDGCLIFKEYKGSESRLCTIDRLLHRINESGKATAEIIIPDREGGLSVKDNDGSVYVLKTYCEGRECNINDRAECLSVVRLLARLHDCTNICEEDDIHDYFSPGNEYEKRNRELKKVYKFLLHKGQKNIFEINLLNTYNMFLEQALQVSEEWNEYMKISGFCDMPDESVVFCHGDYQYHNIIRTDNDWFLANFEKCVPDDHIRDLYLLMRKVLEKTGWQIQLGKEMLDCYLSERHVSAFSHIDLYYRLAYPEKFWKIVNYYYNTRKSWISDRNCEKLDKLIRQETEKQYFLDKVFRSVSKSL
jgi:CotS family spore coat protein